MPSGKGLAAGGVASCIESPGKSGNTACDTIPDECVALCSTCVVDEVEGTRSDVRASWPEGEVTKEDERELRLRVPAEGRDGLGAWGSDAESRGPEGDRGRVSLSPRESLFVSMSLELVDLSVACELLRRELWEAQAPCRGAVPEERNSGISELSLVFDWTLVVD